MMTGPVHIGRYTRRGSATRLPLRRRADDKPYKNTWSDIWYAGSKTSGGFGFWGHSVLHHTDAHKAVRAWVEALREEGWTDEDIVLYGDWTDGRHIADDMEPAKQTLAQMKSYIKENARPKDVVRVENLKNYGRNEETARTVAIYLGLRGYGVYNKEMR